MLNIAIIGATGRMGLNLIRILQHHEKVRLNAAIIRANSTHLGKDSGLFAGIDVNNIPLCSDLAQILTEEAIDAVIDFSTIPSSLETAKLCAQANIPLIIGVTGHDDEALASIERAARHCPIILAANFSVGVNLARFFTEKIANILDDDFDIEIVEMHHKHKIDAPSGTALALGKAAAMGRNIEHDAYAIYERYGQTGAREKGKIGYATLRGGSVIGEHEVIFAGDGERLSIAHKASDRAIFAHGAVRAACYAVKQKNGCYDMYDVLGLA